MLPKTWPSGYESLEPALAGGLSLSKKRKRHSPRQIVRKLTDAGAMLATGKRVGEVLHSLAMSEPPRPLY